MVGMTQYPKPQVVLPPQDHWPNGSQDVVKGNGNNSRNLAAPEHPREQDRKQCFKTGQRSKSPEHPEGRATSHRMRSISNLLELLILAFNELPQIAQIFHWLLFKNLAAGSSFGFRDGRLHQGDGKTIRTFSLCQNRIWDWEGKSE
jgi:hypothetical protein